MDPWGIMGPNGKNASRDIFIHTSGEHPVLPLLEVRGAICALGMNAAITGTAPQIIELRTDAGSVRPEELAERTGYTHGIYLSLFPPDILTARILESVSPIVDVLLDIGTFPKDGPERMEDIGIEACRIEGSLPGISTLKLKNALGSIITKRGGSLNLDAPRRVIKVILSRKIYIGMELASCDRRDMRKRRNQFRPFSLPITLSPNASRALLNLAEVRPGQRILDPFCGTGGIIIEGAMMGARVFGSDLDPAMIEGTRKNLAHLDVECHDLRVADVGRTAAEFPEMDAVVTDPPYGRSTSIRNEDIGSLYRRTFSTIVDILRAGGRCAIVLPSTDHLKDLPASLKVNNVLSVRVHRSLVRYYVSLRKETGTDDPAMDREARSNPVRHRW